MTVIYDLLRSGLRVETTTSDSEAEAFLAGAPENGHSVTAYKELPSGKPQKLLFVHLTALQDFIGDREEAEARRVWLDSSPSKPPQGESPAAVKDHINPSHYQGYLQDLQWLEAMQYLPHFREPACFKASVELQARKYLDRLGGKDGELQEMLKAIWYLKFLAAYIANGEKPIRVKDVEALLAKAA